MRCIAQFFHHKLDALGHIFGNRGSLINESTDRSHRYIGLAGNISDGN